MSNLEGAKFTTAFNLGLHVYHVLGGLFFLIVSGGSPETNLLFAAGLFAMLGYGALHFGVKSSNINITMGGLVITSLSVIQHFADIVMNMTGMSWDRRLMTSLSFVLISLAYMGLQVLTLLLNLSVFQEMKQTPASLASEPKA